MEPIIIARDLHKSFRTGALDVHALRGIDLTVDAGEKVQEAGTKPVLALRAVSSAKKTVSVEVEIELTTLDRTATFSRAPSFPQPVWTHRVEVKVEPGKTREIALAPDLTPAADQLVNVHLRVGKKKVYAAGFAVRAPKPDAGEATVAKQGS